MSNKNTSTKVGGIKVSGLIGMILASFLSYKLGNGVVWIAIHCMFGWLYILYLCLGFGGGFPEGSF